VAVSRQTRLIASGDRGRQIGESTRRLYRSGPTSLDDASLLALALGARTDRAVDRARALLVRVGGARGLARADVAELATFDGVGPVRAARLAAARELVLRAATRWPEPEWTVRTPADVGDRLLPAMGLLEREELRVLVLNTKNVVLAMSTLYVGNLAGSSVRVGEVFRDAVRRLAAGVVVVHNHPSGDPTPWPTTCGSPRRSRVRAACSTSAWSTTS
jgi:DNA repair protein RadC